MESQKLLQNYSRAEERQLTKSQGRRLPGILIENY